MERNQEEGIDMLVDKEVEAMAKVLFAHWQTSDRELQMVWEELDPENQVYKVFMKQGTALKAAGIHP